MWTNKGQINEAVFPDPVSAIPITSLPLKETGIAYEWHY